jgi:hypothetical protein
LGWLAGGGAISVVTAWLDSFWWLVWLLEYRVDCEGISSEKWLLNDCMVGGEESVYTLLIESKINSLDRWRVSNLYISDQSMSTTWYLRFFSSFVRYG